MAPIRTTSAVRPPYEDPASTKRPSPPANATRARSLANTPTLPFPPPAPVALADTEPRSFNRRRITAGLGSIFRVGSPKAKGKHGSRASSGTSEDDAHTGGHATPSDSPDGTPRPSADEIRFASPPLTAPTSPVLSGDPPLPRSPSRIKPLAFLPGLRRRLSSAADRSAPGSSTSTPVPLGVVARSSSFPRTYGARTSSIPSSVSGDGGWIMVGSPAASIGPQESTTPASDALPAAEEPLSESPQALPSALSDSPSSELASSPLDAPRYSPTTGVASIHRSTLFERRQTRNGGDSPTLSHFPNISPTLPLPSPLVDSTPVLAPIEQATTTPPDEEEEATTPPHVMTARRMRNLPRLLSNGGHSFPTLHRPSTGGSHPSVEEGDDDGAELDDGSGTDTETEEAGGSDSSPTDSEVASRRTSTSTASYSPEPVASTSALPSAPPSAPLVNRPSPHAVFGNFSMSTLSPSSTVAPPSWTTFDPLTPTSGAGASVVRTVRAANEQSSGSYFDLPRGPHGGGRTPRPPVPTMSPLIPMSMANVARGKRPTREDQVLPPPSSSVPLAATSPGTPSRDDAAADREGLEIYRRRSHSAADMHSPSLLDADDDGPVGPAALQALHPIWQSGGLATPGPAFLSPLPVAQGVEDMPVRSPVPQKGRGRAPSLGATLGRPRSMYELHVAPPGYHAVYNRAGLGPAQIVYPREEEGREGLPDYTCAVHFEAYMQRKMEFTSPSVQAKDRAWKRQYFVLHGTAIKIYKYDLRTHPIEGEVDWSTAHPVGSDGELPLHFHTGEYGVASEASGSSSKFSTASIRDKAIARSHIGTGPSANVLLRHYSLQSAESGLAADYIKRNHVVRIRAEGEQFLLQAKDDAMVIALIESVQAGTNTALDLDARPNPVFQTLPRRRRRRRITAMREAVAADAAVVRAVLEESLLDDVLAGESHAHGEAAAASPRLA